MRLLRDLRPLREHRAIHALMSLKDHGEANPSTSGDLPLVQRSVRSQDGRQASSVMAASADWGVESDVGSDKLLVSTMPSRRSPERHGREPPILTDAIPRPFAGGRPLHRLSLLDAGTPRRVRLLWIEWSAVCRKEARCDISANRRCPTPGKFSILVRSHDPSACIEGMTTR